MAADTPAAAPKTNAGAHAKSAIFTMMSVLFATKIATWISGQEEYIACGKGINDNSWTATRYQSYRFFDPKTAHYESQYVPMRDGIDLAVDTYMAEYVWKHQEKVPAVVFYTRHGRGYDLDFPFNIFGGKYEKKFTSPRTNVYVDRFVMSGYAWIQVDVRGTGASAGSKHHDFSDQEVEDAYDLVEWITRQPWSNGKVAAVGHGFEGVGALVVAASGHPAVKAISLNGAPVDIFSGAFFPGGVKNKKALHDYASFTYDTDRQIRWREIPALKARIMMNYFGGTVIGVDDDKRKLESYVAQHDENPQLEQELEDVHFLDDKLKTAGVTLRELNGLRLLGKIASSGVAIHAFGGYYDMAVARSTILLFQYLTNTLDADMASLLPPLPQGTITDPRHHRLSLGPWSHAGVDNADPFATSKQKCFWHLEEISRFMDYQMYDSRKDHTKVGEDDPIHYYTLVHGVWKSATTWPPSYLSDQKFFLGLNKSLEEVNAPEGEVTIDATTFNPQYDVQSRWDMIGHLFGSRPFYYHERSPMEDQYVTFMTPELPLTEITGEVELRVFFSVDKPAVNLVAFLEDVDFTPAFPNENKRPGITYMTEALLNPIHQTIRPDASVHSFTQKHGREIVPGQVYEAVLKFEPISWVVKRKHQLRLSIGVATPKDFGPAGPEEASKLTIHFGGDYPSSLKIPQYQGLYKDNIVPPEEDEASDKMETEAPATRDAETDATEDEFAEEEEGNDAKEEL